MGKTTKALSGVQLRREVLIGLRIHQTFSLQREPE